MDKIQTFIDAFKTLEEYLRIEYEKGDYRESTFMGTLFRIKGRKENQIIANPKYFVTLQQAAQLRNIIMHNTDVAEPTDDFLVSFTKIVELIIHPEKVSQVMIPMARIRKVSPEEKIGDAMDLMETYGFSKIPVFVHEHLVGVFTEKAFYYHLNLKKDAVLSRAMRISDLMEAIDLDGHPASYFAFISRYEDVFSALAMFRRDFQEKNKLEMLFVTENGKKGEKVLGILTLPDLENYISA